MLIPEILYQPTLRDLQTLAVEVLHFNVQGPNVAQSVNEWTVQKLPSDRLVIFGSVVIQLAFTTGTSSAFLTELRLNLIDGAQRVKSTLWDASANGLTQGERIRSEFSQTPMGGASSFFQGSWNPPLRGLIVSGTNSALQLRSAVSPGIPTQHFAIVNFTLYAVPLAGWSRSA